MKLPKWIVVGAGLLGLRPGDAAAGRWQITRPHCRTGIPWRDYQHRARSPIVVGVSGTALPLTVDTATGPVEAGIRVFQVLEPELKNGHCAVSRATVRIHEDGRWSISLVARQNAAADDQPLAPAPKFFTGAVPPEQYTGHLLRNEFCVKLRGYALYGTESRDPAISAGPPLMFAVEPPTFWVQRGETRNWVGEGRSDAVQEFYRLIDRIEVEFSYY